MVLAPTAVVDTYAMTASDVTAVLDVLPEVPTVVLSSQDMYRRTPDPGPSGAKRQYRLLRTLRLVPVPDQALASDLVVTGAPAQHLLVSVPGTSGDGHPPIPDYAWPSPCDGTWPTHPTPHGQLKTPTLMTLPLAPPDSAPSV